MVGNRVPSRGWGKTYLGTAMVATKDDNVICLSHVHNCRFSLESILEAGSAN